MHALRDDRISGRNPPDFPDSTTIRFAWVDMEKAPQPLTLTWEMFSLFTSRYHASKAKQRGIEIEETDPRATIRTAHKRNHGVYGSPRIYAKLRSLDVPIGRRRGVQIIQ